MQLVNVTITYLPSNNRTNKICTLFLLRYYRTMVSLPSFNYNFAVLEYQYWWWWYRGCLVSIFKQQFSVFKQHFTYFNTLFHPHVFSQKFLNNNFQFLNTCTKRAHSHLKHQKEPNINGDRAKFFCNLLQ